MSINTGVKRGYAFGDDDVPRDADTEYLKVKYSAKNRAPPVSLCRRGGRCIEKILGAGSTPLEQFLIKRKLMGPCWVRIDAPVRGGVLKSRPNSKQRPPAASSRGDDHMETPRDS